VSEVALLNPQVESDLAISLIALGQKRIDALSNKLLRTELSHNEYLKAFGAITALQMYVDDMTETYQRKVNV